jgi:amino acid adenylation domain-containing protein
MATAHYSRKTVLHTGADAATERQELIALLLRRRGIATQQGAPIAQSSRPGPAELSFAQRRLWFLEQLSPGRAGYNMPGALRLLGTLNVAALRETLTQIVSRHETLRTAFISSGGEVRQCVRPPWTVPLGVIDLAGLPSSLRQREANRLASQEGQRPFDLSSGMPLRGILLRLGEREHVIVFTLHHIVCDGWSLGILTREVSMLYEAYSSGRAPSMPPLPVQYRDYSAWQHATLRGKALEGHLEYWRAQLADLPTVQLPTDRARPATQTYRGGSLPFHLDADLITKLQTVNATERATVFMAMAAALYIFLHCYTGQRDLAIGAPIAGRSRPEVENLIGFFVNQLVLRNRLAGSMSFRELLRQVRSTTLDAFAHQDLPFECLVRELDPERDETRNPLFQVSLAVQNAPMTDLSLANLEARPFQFNSRTSRFDIEVHVHEGPAGIGGVWLYSAELFEEETAARMLQMFLTLLRGAVADPDRPLSDLPLVAPQEHRIITSEWNRTECNYGPARCVHELFAEAVASNPDAPAVICGSESLTYTGLNRRSDRLARRLQSMGVGPEVRVGVCLRRSPSLIISTLAVMKAGGVWVPFDPASPPSRICEMLAHADTRLLITSSDYLPLLPWRPEQVLPIDDELAADALGSARIESPRAPALENLAYIIHTSGSTGQPKGVMITHGGLMNYLQWAAQYYGPPSGMGVLVHSSAAFDLTITSLLVPLITGRCLVLLPDEPGIEPLNEGLRDVAEQWFLKLTPSHLRSLDPALPAQAAARLRCMIVGGEQLRAEDLRPWSSMGARVFNEYGPTETVVGSTVYAVPEDGSFSGPVPIGKPIGNTRLYVLNSYLHPVPVGVPGELYIAGHGVARGYLNRPDLTAASFLPDPFSQAAGSRMYRTGDIVRYRADGVLFFEGRRDGELKIRGYRVDPREVECALSSCPGIDQAAVVALGDQSGVKSLAAFVVPAEEPAGSSDTAESVHGERVAQWRMVFNQTYADSAAHRAQAEDFGGWNSSYTGLPIPQDEMREWLQNTLGRIRALQPRRVLEIGCGTGLVLFSVAEGCAEYWGSDLSAAALASVRRRLEDLSRIRGRVRLLEQAADSFAGIPPRYFDTIVLNSVVQYFPSSSYLLRVIGSAIEAAALNGSVFIGDVRCLPLLEAFHCSVQLHRAPASARSRSIVYNVARHVMEEEELVLDPAFFLDLQHLFPRIGSIEIAPRRGCSRNELTCFRYDVSIHLDSAPVSRPEALVREWKRDGLSLAGIRTLVEDSQPDVLLIGNIPNRRTGAAIRALRLLKDSGRPESVAKLKEELERIAETGVDPEDVWSLADEFPAYTVNISWIDCNQTGAFHAIFQKRDLARPAEVRIAEASQLLQEGSRSRTRVANDPLRMRRARGTVPALRQALQQRLPAYMIPQVIEAVPALPRTAGGKLDYNALAERRPVRSRDPFRVSARDAVEQIVAGIWADVLDIEEPESEENFFELGGHSLLATQVISRVRSVFGIELQLRALFQNPKLSAFAERVRSALGGRAEIPPLVSRPRPSHVPLSFAQQRLWFLEQLFPGNRAYHVPLSLRFSGHLDRSAFARSLDALRKRHEVLRTSFPLVSGEPVQKIEPPQTERLPLIDLSALPHRRADTAAREIVTSHSSAPFDLLHGPGIRCALVCLDKTDHVACLTLHHIVTDGWSMNVLVREMTELYNAFAGGSAPQLPQPTLQYADFAIWQREWLRDEALARQLAYWTEQLAGPLPALRLPYDRERRLPSAHRGAIRSHRMSSELRNALVGLSRREGVTLFMTILSAFALVLQHETGQDDIPVGTDIANRNHYALEQLVGFFVNQLALRIRPGRCETFRELLKQVRDTTLGAYEHQDAPFEKVVDALKLERNLSGFPLVQVSLSMANAPAAALNLRGLSCELVPVALGTCKMDWLLTMVEIGDGLLAVFEYDRDLFEAATIDRVLRKLEIALSCASSAATDSVAAIGTALSEADRQDRRAARDRYRRVFEDQMRSTPAAF